MPGAEGDDGFRVEHDSLGEVRVPTAARWGAQTQRAVENFPISGRPINRRLIRALALVKLEAAHANAGLADVPGVDGAIADAIVAAASEVADGAWDDEFPVDVFPSAIHLATVEAITRDLLPALAHLEVALTRKQVEFADVVKSGRTHLMDATPVTLGQEFGGYAAQIGQDLERLHTALPRLSRLPLGGTAVGTGINAPAGFARTVIAGLAERTGLPLVEAPDHFASQGARDDLVELSGHLRTVAVSLTKIANDIRWMGSGPRAGLAEIRLPDLQPGSSIMPGKVNPVLAEAVTQVAAQVFGNDAAVAFGGAQGNFELNVYVPMMAANVLDSIQLLTNVSWLFADRCLAGIEADDERCRAYAEASPSLGTSLNPYIGYEKASALVKESVRTGRSIRELVHEQGLLSDEELDRAFDVLRMTHGGIQR